MRIFVTGATGFLGQHIVSSLLNEGKENTLLLLTRKSSRTGLADTFGNKSRVKIITGDLNVLSKIEKKIQAFDPQVCIHLAWEGIPDYSYGTSKQNLDCSIELINFLTEKTKCKKFIISGSCWEYGKIVGRCKEEDTTLINSYFIWAKNALYQYANIVCKKNKRDLIWFRIFYVYGPGQRQDSLIPMISRSIKEGDNVSLKCPSNANDFIYVTDVVQAFTLAVRKRIKSGIYNLGRGRAEKLSKVLRLVEKEMKVNTKSFLSSMSTRNGMQAQRFYADTKKTQETLSWTAKVSLKDGIHQYLLD